MPKNVPIGARASLEQTVEHKHTLAAHHELLPPVLSTPDMIRLMETACFRALQEFADEGEITVGTAIHVSHRAPTGIGSKVRAEAVLEKVDGRFFVMRCTAHDGEKLLGEGTVDRAFINVKNFMVKTGK